MNSIPAILRHYDCGYITIDTAVAELLFVINTDDIKSDMDCIPPDIAKALRDFVLSSDWPWQERQGVFLLSSHGVRSLSPAKFETIRSWLLRA